MLMRALLLLMTTVIATAHGCQRGGNSASKSSVVGMNPRTYCTSSTSFPPNAFVSFGRKNTNHWVSCFAAKPTKAKKNKQNRATGGGFGGGTTVTQKNKKNANTVAVPPMSPMAKQLLKKHGNNVDAASSDFFASLMKQHQELNNINQHAFHAAKVKVSEKPGNRISTASSSGTSTAQKRKCFVCLIFFPYDGLILIFVFVCFHDHL